MKWEIETGNKSWMAEAVSIKQAIAWAWDKRPPTSLGDLVRFRNWNREHGASKSHGVWKYIDSIVALQWAGYDVDGR